MPTTESTNVTKTVDTKGKVQVKATTSTSISSTKKSYHERYQMVSLLSLPTFIILFILFVFGSTVMYFNNHKSTYMPGGNTYVEYTEQQMIDLQLDYGIADLNNHSLREVFEDYNLVPYNMTQSTHNGLTFKIINGVSYISGTSTVYTSKTLYGAKSSSKWLMRNKIITGSSSASLYIISPSGNVFVTNTAQTSLLTERPITRVSYEINVNITFDNYSAIIWVVDVGYLGIDTLTVSQMDYWYSVYQDLKEKGYHQETRLALGTIDPNTGRDFYHLDVQDYYDLGVNSIQGFKGLTTFIKATSSMISDVGDFIAKTSKTIGEFYDKAYDFMGGGSLDSIWAETQNIWKWITGKGWAVK